MNIDQIQICQPKTDEEYELVKEIFIEYQQYLAVDLCFQNFETELANIKTVYAEPKGTIIIAKDGGNLAGCIAFKPIETNICEMKRLYVKPQYRALGLGRILTEKLIAKAITQQYVTMKLDTLTTLTEAVKLYKSLGFVETKPYVYNPLNNVLYFEKTLQNDI
jgi:putative acetyltransferase